MARAEHLVLHWNAAVTRGTAALVAIADALPREPIASHGVYAQANVVGLAAGLLPPAFEALSRACEASAGRPSRRDPCIAIAKALQAGDTLLAEGVGLTLERTLRIENSPEWLDVVERRRVFDWRVSRMPEVERPRWPRSWRARAREYADLQARLPREQDVVLELMRRHGLPTEPPPGWTRDGG